ncbi:hypothetical protein XHC_1282 [Xanthomonas hortorum pv. carotae str. M081]|nr:hypothetical protein XHC_1282 [Xanthomonas hortorum pv. carotae str. M081]
MVSKRGAPTALREISRNAAGNSANAGDAALHAAPAVGAE